MKVIPMIRAGYADFQGLQFACVDRTTNKMTSFPQKCKELFADAYFYQAQAKEKRFRFAITLTLSDKILNAESTQDFLNQIEAEMDFSKSKVWKVDVRENTQALLIDSSTQWLKSSPLFHLLLLLARNGSRHDPKKGYKATLAKFRRTDTAFQVTDKPQFLIAKDAIPHIVSRKGNLEAFRIDNTGHYIQTAPNWQKGLGICQWATQLVGAK